MAAHENPNDRQHRPFLLPGDYPPASATEEDHGFQVDAFEAEQSKRERALKDEGHTMHGDYPSYPDRGMPNSPEMYDRQMEEQAYMRACHGGVPDAPEALRQGKKPFKGLKG